MKQPNILLLMADQHRADYLGAAQAVEGRSWIQTPALDQLCREGVRFARAYTESPVCVSARATLMTGLLPHHTGVFDNGYRLDTTVPTLPRSLAEQGYHCQAIGKMHFSPVREHHGLHRLWLSEEIPGTPEQDEFLRDLIGAGYQHVEEPHGIRHELYYVPQVSQLPEGLHTTAWTGRKTVEYLEEHVRQRRGQPFFCWTSFIKPHPPFDPPVPWHTLYRPTDSPDPVRRVDELERHTYYHRTQNRFKWTDQQPDRNLLRMIRAYYAACVSFIDFWVGQVLDTLARLDLRQDTLIFYVADHGEYLGDHFAFGKRGFHDQPSRVPFILSWPGTLPQGETRHQLVGLEDVMPTALDAAGGSGAAAALRMDGRSVLEPARDSGAATRDVWFGQLAEQVRGLYCAMDQEWKYVYSAPDDHEYLLHRGVGEGRVVDEQECHDHAADPAAQAHLERLREAIQERFRHDGYAAPLDDSETHGWRRHPAPEVPWEPLDEMVDRSVAGRGWQYARWNTKPPFDTPEWDRRLDPAKAAYRFPSHTVK